MAYLIRELVYHAMSFMSSKIHHMKWPIFKVTAEVWFDKIFVTSIIYSAWGFFFRSKFFYCRPNYVVEITKKTKIEKKPNKTNEQTNKKNTEKNSEHSEWIYIFWDLLPTSSIDGVHPSKHVESLIKLLRSYRSQKCLVASDLDGQQFMSPTKAKSSWLIRTESMIRDLHFKKKIHGTLWGAYRHR